MGLAGGGDGTVMGQDKLFDDGEAETAAIAAVVIA